MTNPAPLSMNIYPEDPLDVRILIKVCNAEYVDDVLNGNLYMKPFEYFRSLEEKKVRGDELEGIDASYRSEDITLQMKDKNGIFIPIGGLIGRTNFHNNYIKNTNLFSMSGFSLENLTDGNNQFFLDSRFSTFGDKAVIIYDAPAFFSKIKNGFETQQKIIQIPNEPFYFRHIDYVSDNYNGRLGVFRKFNTYSWQQELRIAIYRNVKSLSPKPYVFRIGSLKHISVVFDTEHLITEGLLINCSSILQK